MVLSEFLRVRGLSLADFAARCDTSASTILRVRDGDVVPSRRVLDAIWRETDGYVTSNDLVGTYCKIPCPAAETCETTKTPQSGHAQDGQNKFDDQKGSE